MRKYAPFLALVFAAGAIASGLWAFLGYSTEQPVVWHVNDQGQMVSSTISAKENAELTRMLVNAGYSDAKGFADEAEAEANKESQDLMKHRIIYGSLCAILLIGAIISATKRSGRHMQVTAQAS